METRVLGSDHYNKLLNGKQIWTQDILVPCHMHGHKHYIKHNNVGSETYELSESIDRGCTFAIASYCIIIIAFI